MEHSQYSIHSVASNSYLDTYCIQTPDGIEKYDLHYKAGGIFLQAKPKAQSIHTTEICRMLNDEQNMPYSFSYIPSEEIFENMYGMIRSACDTFGVQITNVVENKTNYNVIYYLRTSSTFSYIKIYFDSSRFVKYAQPMSLIGEEDSELCNVVEEIKKRFV
jgi:homoserine trans-succinylase